MATQQNDKEQQGTKNNQDSGTQYHQERTSEEMGYGAIDPNAEQQGTMTDKTGQ